MVTQRNDGGPDAADKNIEPNFRDMCAMFAMSAIVAQEEAHDSCEEVAMKAYEYADALLAARERT